MTMPNFVWNILFRPPVFHLFSEIPMRIFILLVGNTGDNKLPFSP